MNRKIRTSISFIINPDLEPIEYDDMSDEALMSYAKDCFYDDIISLVKENDLMDFIDVELIND